MSMYRSPRKARKVRGSKPAAMRHVYGATWTEDRYHVAWVAGIPATRVRTLPPGHRVTVGMYVWDIGPLAYPLRGMLP